MPRLNPAGMRRDTLNGQKVRIYGRNPVFWSGCPLPGGEFKKETSAHMAETTEKSKKAKAPAKPRAAAGTAAATEKKAAAKTSTSKKQPAATPRVPSHEEIARLAQKYWAERGHHDGHAEQDWLRAEQELMKQAS